MQVEGDWIAVLGDLHAPYADQRAFNVTCQILSDLDPFAVVLNGDNLDCYQISKYSQDPKRKLEFQRDLDICRGHLGRLKCNAKGARFYYTEGNHERRLTDWVWKNAEVSSLEALTIPSLLGLEEDGITWVPERERLTFGDWLITHGTSCCSKAGATAQKMIDRFGCSGISNHVHRLAQVSRTIWNKQHTWIENGCLCDLQLPYLDTADWQHGFTILHKDTDGQVWPEVISIRDGRAWYNGKCYKA